MDTKINTYAVSPAELLKPTRQKERESALSPTSLIDWTKYDIVSLMRLGIAFIKRVFVQQQRAITTEPMRRHGRKLHIIVCICYSIYEVNCASCVGSYIRTSYLLCVLQERLVYTNQTTQILPAQGKLQQIQPHKYL